MGPSFCLAGSLRYKFIIVVVLFLSCVGCTNINKNMKVTDSNTESQYFAISKNLGRQWKVNLSYLQTEGSQSPTLELKTTYSEPDSSSSSGGSRVRWTESFSLENINFVSPTNGSTRLGVDYDLNITGAELEHTFSRSYPFSVDLSFGIMFMDTGIHFHELGQDNTQVFSYSKLHPKAGMDFSYALHPKLVISTFVGRSYDLEEVRTLQYGVAISLSPVKSLEFSARAYTFQSNFGGSKSSLDIHHNGTALGIKLNF